MLIATTSANPAASTPVIPPAAALPETNVPAPVAMTNLLTPTPEHVAMFSPAQAALHPPSAMAKGSVIGATIRFKGDLTADEDLVIHGRIEGTILVSRSLTLSADGGMIGDIRARHIVVEGNVKGDLHALESVIVRASGTVSGNIHAPRVAILDGATFNGRVDMERARATAESMAANPEASARDLTSADVDAWLTSGPPQVAPKKRGKG